MSSLLHLVTRIAPAAAGAADGAAAKGSGAVGGADQLELPSRAAVWEGTGKPGAFSGECGGRCLMRMMMRLRLELGWGAHFCP